MNLSVVILTFNEEQNLPRCMEGLAPLECRIYVVDSGSTDGTLEIAEKSGATIVHHAFTTHSEQWAWALRNLPLESEWVLGLDADQRLTPELAEELNRNFANGVSRDIDGFYINRRQIFRGRWIKHGGYYPKYLLKLFRRDRVFFDPLDFLDHHFYVPGKTALLRNDLIEDNRKEDDIVFWVQKHTRYACLVAMEEQKRRTEGLAGPLKPAFFGSPDQRVLFLKKCWRRFPLFVRPVFYFAYRYFIRGGWMDGKNGFLFHFMQGFWFRVLIDAKLDQMPATGPSEIR